MLTPCTSSAANATVQEKISQCEVDSIDTGECLVNLFCEGSSGGLRIGCGRGAGKGCDGKSKKGGKMLVVEQYVRGVLRSGYRIVRAA